MFFNKKSAYKDWLSPYYVLGIAAGTGVVPLDIGAVQSRGRTSFVTGTRVKWWLCYSQLSDIGQSV